MQPSDHPVLAVCRMCLTVTKSTIFITLCYFAPYYYSVYSIPGSTGGLRPLEKVVSSLKLAGFISISEVSLTYIILLSTVIIKLFGFFAGFLPSINQPPHAMRVK